MVRFPNDDDIYRDDDTQVLIDEPQQSGKPNERVSWTKSKTWRRLRPFAILALSLLIVCIGISIAFNYVDSHYLSPVRFQGQTDHTGGH